MSDFAPEAGPDGRPRPRYGEYATPEEQRARIAQPAVTDALSAGVTPAAAPAASTPPASAEPGKPVPVAARRSMLDRIFTVALLGYGLFIVITSIPTVADYTGFAASFFDTLGVDATLTDPGAGRGWGLASALVLGIGWLAAAVLSWRNLRAGRISFWIPLVAGIVCTMIASLLLVVPLMMDPGAWAALQGVIDSAGTE